MSYGSLSKANRGTFGIGFGQSNMNRCGNNTGTAAAAGFASIPVGATYYDFITQATQMLTYSAPHHSLECALLDRLVNFHGKVVTFAKRGADGTSLTQWNSTHAATLKSDITTAGLGVPAWGILAQGENEASASAGAADGWDGDLINVMGKFRMVYGGAFGLVVIRLHSGMNGTWRDNVRVRQAYAAANHWHINLVDIDAGGSLAGDAIHWTSGLASAAGVLVADRLVSTGLVP